MLNRLRVTHECDRRTDGQTDGRTYPLTAYAICYLSLRCAANDTEGCCLPGKQRWTYWRAPRFQI